MNDERTRKFSGEQVRKFRSDKGLSQKEFGKILGIGQSFLSQIERGDKSIPKDRIDDFADALGVSPDDLLPPTGPIEDQDQMEDWRDMVGEDQSLSFEAKALLLILTNKPFVDRDKWIASFTTDEAAEAIRKDRDATEEVISYMVETPYAERIGSVKWLIKFVIPE